MRPRVVPTAQTAVFLLLGLVSVVVLLPNMPIYRDIFGGDTGVFLYIGERILKGDVPYRDIWDHKAPLIFYINALALLIGGGSIWGLWVVELITLVCAAWIGFVLLKQAFGMVPALFGSVLWVASLALVLIGGNYTEEFALPFQFAALYLFWRAERQASYIWRGLLIGVTLAAVSLLRPNLIGIHLAIVIVMMLRTPHALREKWGLAWGEARPDQWRRLGINLVVIGVGALIVLLPVSAYFLTQGALGDLLDQVFRYSAFYSNTTLENRIRSLLIGISALSVSGISIIALFSWLIAIMHFRRGLYRNQDRWILLLVALINLPIEFILSTLSGRVYGHYYIAWMPSFAILAACFASFAIELAVPLVKAHWTSIAPLIVLPALCIMPGWKIIDDINTPKELGNSRYQVANYILSYTREDDYVLVWGAETAIHLVTHRDAPTRFVYQYPLYARGYQRGAQVEEFLHDLTLRPPAVIIDTSMTNSLIPPLDPAKRAHWAPDDPAYGLLPEMDAVLEYIGSNYVLAGTIGQEHWSIYRFVGRNQTAGH